MALFGSRKSSEPEAPRIDPTTPTAPAEDPRFVEMGSKISELTETVNRFVQTATAPRPMAPAPAPQLPAIEDISEEAFEQALDEGGAAARKAIKVRQAAEQERLRREFNQQLAAVQGPGMAAINDIQVRTLLADNELYKTDAAIKKDVDQQLGQLKSQGMLISNEAVEWVVQKVTGEHTPRLLKENQEKYARQLREEQATPDRGRKRGRDVQGEKGNGGAPQPWDLTPDADVLLQSRNHGRGQTPDDFAKTLPKRTIVDTQGKRVRLNYNSWDEMMQRYQEARDEYENEQYPAYFGGNK